MAIKNFSHSFDNVFTAKGVYLNFRHEYILHSLRKTLKQASCFSLVCTYICRIDTRYSLLTGL